MPPVKPPRADEPESAPRTLEQILGPYVPAFMMKHLKHDLRAWGRAERRKERERCDRAGCTVEAPSPSTDLSHDEADAWIDGYTWGAAEVIRRIRALPDESEAT